MLPYRFCVLIVLLIFPGVTAVSDNFSDLLQKEANRQRDSRKQPILLVSNCDECIEYSLSDRDQNDGWCPEVDGEAFPQEAYVQPPSTPGATAGELVPPQWQTAPSNPVLSDPGNLPNPMNMDPAVVDAFNDSLGDSAAQPRRRTAPRQFTPNASQVVNLNTIGDFYGGALRTISMSETQSYAFHTQGFIASGAPGSASAVLVFEANGGIPDDFTTIGLGQDLDGSGDGFADTFNMSEPLPPNEVPTSPGPGYTFDGGTVVFTGDATTTSPIAGVFPASGPNNTWYASYSFSREMQLTAPIGGLSMRRIKLSEQNSPLPTHRVYGSLNYYDDVPNGGGDITRYFVGIEKAFFHDQISLDLRMPFASTLDSDQTTAGVSGRNSEFGNIVLTAKALLLRRQSWLLSGGVGVGFPTADDTRILSAQSGAEVLRIDNDSFHILPFFAGRWTPASRCYLQWFLQWDVDANGNDVRARPNNGALSNIGRLQDQTLTFVDVSIGHWLRNDRSKKLWGIVPTAELHYSTTSQDADTVSGNGFQIGNTTNRYDVLNMTLGSHFMFCNNWTVTPAMAIPLRRDNLDDKQFDYEALAQIERRF